MKGFVLASGNEECEGYSAGNVFASYIHLNFAAGPEAAATFVRNCRQSRAQA